jgi:ELWxxDGT repeat protein
MKKNYKNFFLIASLSIIGGTTNAQSLVKDIFPGTTGSNPNFLTNVNGTVYFTGKDGTTTNSAIFKSDGTEAGTKLVNSSVSLSFVQTFGNIGSTIIFNGGGELFKSDGTNVGTVMVKKIRPSLTSHPTGFKTYKDIVYFSCQDPGLWRTDGTLNGTYKLLGTPINPGRFTEMNGILYFGTSNGELWKTDGTVLGTVMIKDLNPATAGVFLRLFTVVNNKLFFVVDDGVSGTELWVSDGTDPGTFMVKDIKVGSGSGVDESAGSLTNVNGTLFFAANDGITGTEIWKSDGTGPGTVLVKDLKAGSASSLTFPSFTSFKGVLYFAADGGPGFVEFWKSDGTGAGTVKVKTGVYSPSELIVVNDILYFRDRDALWKCDGTESGTVKIPGVPTPYSLINANGNLFFVAGDAVDKELWVLKSGVVLSIDGFNEDQFGVFPNPTSGRFTIAFQDQFTSLAVCNVLGETVYSTSLKDELSYQLDLSGAPKGVYFVNLSEGAKIHTKKIIVQ